jgi:GMP synthase (glutamine-hydrolysing)
MRKLLVCQHVAFEVLGTLDPLLRHAGFRIRYVNFGRHPHAEPNIDRYAGLVILGGPMNVDDTARHPHLLTELRLIERALALEIPVLGICLGAQLIARALGAEVRPNGEKEIGWYDVTLTEAGAADPVLGHFRPTEKVFQWHGHTFDVPRGAAHLARSPGCESQAFRYGRDVYGFQFHLEVDEPLIERWLTVPQHVRELASLDGRVCPESIRRQTPAHIGPLKSLSDRTFGEFIRLLPTHRRRVAHPSR